MSDASTMNKPDIEEAKIKNIKFFNCIAHAVRKFKDIEAYYPEECGYFISQVKEIYKNDKLAKDKNMDSKERQLYHAKESKIYIENIYKKVDYLLDNKLVEPNSHLGSSMRYWRKHKEELTRFLKEGGMELDNNQSERNLKSLILQRKNSLFFSTLSSSKVLSGLSSIISTCIENKIDAYGYLNWIQKNSKEVRKNPLQYMPWSYEKYLRNTEPIAA